MIQRIQTLYLLIASAMVAVAVFTPLADMLIGVEQHTLTAFSLSGEQTLPTIVMGVILSASALLPLLIVFLYKHRQLQMRLCGVELALLFGALAFIVATCAIASRAAGEQLNAFSIHIGTITPVVALIFVFLAMRAILRDELLVRSLDRIR